MSWAPAGDGGSVDRRAGCGSVSNRLSGSRPGGAVSRRDSWHSWFFCEGSMSEVIRPFDRPQLAEQLKHLDAVNIGAAGTFVIRRPVDSGATPRRTGIQAPVQSGDRDLPGPRDCQADGSESFRGPAHATRHRTLRERPVSTPTLGAVDAHEHSFQWHVAAEDPREGQSVRPGPVPAPHEGHRLPRHDRPPLRCTGHHAQLEYHDRHRQSPGEERARSTGSRTTTGAAAQQALAADGARRESVTRRIAVAHRAGGWTSEERRISRAPRFAAWRFMEWFARARQ